MLSYFEWMLGNIVDRKQQLSIIKLIFIANNICITTFIIIGFYMFCLNACNVNYMDNTEVTIYKNLIIS